MKRALISATAALSLCGCVSLLNVNRYVPGTDQVGYPYRLRLTQYQMTLTWRVTDCKVADGPQALKLKLSADSKETTALDPEQFYVIDPRSLQGPFRTTEFTMDWYEDRTPKSITSSVDDQSVTAIGNVLQGVAKLAATGLLPAGDGAPGVCTDDVTKALLAINGVKGDRAHLGQRAITDSAQKALDDQTALVTRLTAMATAMGATIDDTTRRNLGQARGKLEALTNVLTLEQATLKQFNDVLTYTKTFTWPETGSSFAGDPQGYMPPPAVATRWNLNVGELATRMFVQLAPLDDLRLAAASGSAPPAPAGALPGDGVPDLGQPQPAQQGTAMQQRKQPMPKQGKTKFPGLPYREPGRVRLIVCTGAPCNLDPQGLEAANRLVASTNGLALQGGSMMYLPFRAQTFAHIKNSVGFAQSGVLTSAGTSQLRGAGSGVTEAIKTTGEQASAIVDAAHGATTKRLTAQADEAKAQKALADAQSALSPAPNAAELAQIAALQTEATLATAQKSVYDAQAALAASKAAAGL